MGSATIKIVFRKDKLSATGKAPIYVRFIKDRKPCYIATGISLEMKYWDFERNLIKKTFPNSVRMNNYLRRLEIEYTDKVFNYQTQDLKINTKQLKKVVTGVETTSFFKVAEEIISKYKLEGKIGTQDKSKSIINKVKEFHKQDNLTLDEINVRFITEYENFVMETYKNKRNTINKDLKFIKRVFNYAIQQELIKADLNPFNKIVLHNDATNRDFLSTREIALLEDYKGSELENKIVYTSLFQYYSGGLRISDVLLLRKKDVENGRLTLTIKKTGKHLNHVLTDKPQNIINIVASEKEENELVFNFLPAGKVLNGVEAIDNYISSTTALINKYLKKIAEKIGLKKSLSSHIFRHSFAVNALEKGVRMEHLKEILKHSNIRETEIYGKVQSKEVDTALKQFSRS